MDKSTEQNRFFFYYWHFALPGSLSTNCGGRVVDSIASKAFYMQSCVSSVCGREELAVGFVCKTDCAARVSMCSKRAGVKQSQT